MHRKGPETVQYFLLAYPFSEADLKATFDFTAQLKLGLESDTLPEDLQAEVDKILAADLVVLQFPIYWLGLPAILKGTFYAMF